MSLQKVISEHRRKFYNIYHKDVRPLLEGFNVKRKSYISNIYFYEIITLIIFSITIFFALNNFEKYTTPIIIILLICFLAFLLIPVHFNLAFTRELKEYCMTPILRIFGKIQWKPDTISNSDLNDSELFATFNRRSNDDGFKGEYKGVKFEIIETNLAFESGSGKNKTYRQIFNGVIVKFKTNKTIKNKTIITTKGDMNTKNVSWFTIFLTMCPFILLCMTASSQKVTIIITIFAITTLILLIASLTDKKQEKLKPIKLEDPIFAKKFNAYSSDEIEGRYLITTSFMERFKNLNTAFGSKRAKCSFYGDNIMFAISTNKNLFEIGNLFSNPDDPKQMDTFFNELESILLLVDYFKLDQHTGL